MGQPIANAKNKSQAWRRKKRGNPADNRIRQQNERKRKK